MAAGYTSFEAFWTGGASAGFAIAPPPTPSADTGGGSFHSEPRGTSTPHWSVRDFETIPQQRKLAEQRRREDDELATLMTAIMKCL